MRALNHSKTYSKIVLSLAALAMLAVPVFYSAPAGAQSARPRYEQDLGLVFTNHEELRLDPAAVARQVRNSGHLSLTTKSSSFEIDLVPNDVRAPGYRAEEVGLDGVTRTIDSGPVNTYRGKVAGRPETEARFTVDDRKVEGMIITAQGSYFIESATKYSAAADAADYLLYKASDVRPDQARTWMKKSVPRPGESGRMPQPHRPMLLMFFRL